MYWNVRIEFNFNLLKKNHFRNCDWGLKFIAHILTVQLVSMQDARHFYYLVMISYYMTTKTLYRDSRTPDVEWKARERRK